MKIKGLLNSLGRNLINHRSDILIGVGIAGMITSSVLAVKQTPKAMKLLDELKEEKKEVKKIDVVKATWKCYISPVAVGIVSGACIIVGSKIKSKTIATLLTAYKLTETSLRDYKDIVKEILPEDKFEELKDKLAKKNIVREDPYKLENMMSDNSRDLEDVLCYEPLSGRYFWSTRNKIERALNNINKDLRQCMYVSLNELYDELDLPHTELGETMGWNVNQEGEIDIQFSTFIDEKSGTPVLSLNFYNMPVYDYYKIY